MKFEIEMRLLVTDDDGAVIADVAYVSSGTTPGAACNDTLYNSEYDIEPRMHALYRRHLERTGADQ